MPTYHYACSTCKSEFDQYQTYAEDSLTVCPTCEGSIRRVILPVGVVFKGSGWYLTDSRKAQGDAAEKAALPPVKAGDGKAADGVKPEAAKTDSGSGTLGKPEKSEAPSPKPSGEKSSAEKSPVASKPAAASS